MDFKGLFPILMTAATVLERLIEAVKPLYLQIKNRFSKIKYSECSKTEKIIMSVILGPVLCISARIGIDIPQLNEPALIQYISAGLIISLGSNYLHAVLSIVIAIKDAAEGLRRPADPSDGKSVERCESTKS
jgi:hypothetical protein